MHGSQACEWTHMVIFLIYSVQQVDLDLDCELTMGAHILVQLNGLKFS